MILKKILKISFKLLFFLLVAFFLFIASIPIIAHGKFVLSDEIDQGWIAFWLAATIWLFIFRFFAKRFLTGRKPK